MYSQSAEEQHILDYFGDFIGTFIDIGCNDCETFSNTRALALRGWKGVLIDPSPSAIKRCRELYKGHKGIYIYDYAISSHNGKAILQESGPLCSAADTGLVSTFHNHEKERFQKTVKYDPIEVKTFKWKTARNRWIIKDFDMISLDIEGDEMNVLPDIDLSKTRLICIEWNSKPELKNAYEKYLEGFKVIYTSAENLVYARV
jgi:FkbM family methyltransferase